MFVCFYVWFVILGSGFCRVSSVSLIKWRNWIWNGYPFDLKDQRRIPRSDDSVLLMASWWWIWVVDDGFGVVDGGFGVVDWRGVFVDGESWVCLCFFFLPLYFGFVCVLSLFAFWDFAQTVLGFFIIIYYLLFFMRICIFFLIYGFDFLEVSILIVLEFFVLRLILSGLVNCGCLDLEKNMKNEVLRFFWVWLFLDLGRTWRTSSCVFTS